MTKEEAIRVLKEAVDSTQEEYDMAFNLAIEAMEKLIKLEKWMEVQTDDMR